MDTRRRIREFGCGPTFAGALRRGKRRDAVHGLINYAASAASTSGKIWKT